MNTPAHLIMGAAAFGKPGHRRVTIAAVAGAMAPDISLYAMVSWSIYVLGVEPRVVFGQYYFSSAWQQVFAIDNSFVLWGLALGLALWSRKPALIAFAGAGLLHLVFDFPLHNDDARMHFWPISDWVFASPISYWDPRFHANIIGPLELAIAMVLSAFMLGRYKTLRARALIVVLAGTEIMATGFFGWFFLNAPH